MEKYLTTHALNDALRIIYGNIEESDMFTDESRLMILKDFQVYLYDNGLPETLIELRAAMQQASERIGVAVHKDFAHEDVGGRPASARLLIINTCSAAIRAAEEAMNIPRSQAR